jgi:hypothetical protein
MYVRWQSRKQVLGKDVRWTAIAVESERVGGRPTQRHVAYLGGISESAINNLAAQCHFWVDVEKKLDGLGRRMTGKDRNNVEAAVAERIPRPTDTQLAAFIRERECLADNTSFQRSRGRPKVPFLESPRRFEVALYVTLSSLGMPPFMAARLVVFLLKARKPIAATVADRFTNVMSTEHSGDVDQHADHIIRYVSKITREASAAEDRWIIDCALYLRALILNPTDPATVAYCTETLVALGWKGPLTGFMERLAPALRSNLLPFQGTTRKQRKALRLQRRHVEGMGTL